ncbi:hypothetical protein DM860_002632 [Cuscuta australis]|uniref:Uncharacterized protein n=1 Tax=Cuscuta australis TaxID=267555 RepID=A0A328CZF7_9ASTE|nr:hypothetical protein DM860_002632 [Cuscuta australis]
MKEMMHCWLDLFNVELSSRVWGHWVPLLRILEPDERSCTESGLHCRLPHRNRRGRGFTGGDGSWRTGNAPGSADFYSTARPPIASSKGTNSASDCFYCLAAAATMLPPIASTAATL